MTESNGPHGLTRQSLLRLAFAASLQAAAGTPLVGAICSSANAGDVAETSPTQQNLPAPAQSKPQVAKPQGAKPQEAKPQEVAPGVFVHKGTYAVYAPSNGGDICNTGFIIGDKSVAVIDTGGTAKIGTELVDHIRALTDRPIRHVINTHMHPDHVLGNIAFKQFNPEFLAHHKLAAALAARAERYLSYNRAAVGDDAFAGTQIVLPTRGITGTEEVDLGGRQIILTAQPTAHTDNDLTIKDSKTGTLFTGDLIFSRHIPTLDGSIRGWLTVLDALAAMPQARIVPGHGPASMAWPAAAAPVKRYLDTIANGVRAAIKDGHTIQHAIATVGQSERQNWLLFDEFNARNVSAAFAELEWE